MTTMDYAGALLADSDDETRGAGRPFSLRSRVTIGLLLGLMLLGVGGTWAATAKISGAVIASGAVKVVQHVKEVQHPDGGIVANIAVREGDTVKAGQLLIQLDDVQIRAELAIVSGQLNEQQGRRARLLAERDGLTSIAFPEAFEQPTTGLASTMAGETQLFSGNLLSRSRNKEQLHLQIEQLGQEVIGLQGQLEALDNEIALVGVERAKLAELQAGGLIEGSRLYTIDRELTRLQGQRSEVHAGAARVEGRMAEVRLQLLAVDETARNEAQRELRVVDASIAELAERRTAVADRLLRAEIRSPIDGIVNELDVTTIGGVITPAERLVTIVPTDADLTVEIRLATVDVDQITLNQPAKLRFSAFNQRTTPEIDGRIVHVSAAAQRDPATGESFYTGEVEITGDMADLGDVTLIPGMPVEVFVQTQEMTALTYVAKPFTDQIARAFREE